MIHEGMYNMTKQKSIFLLFATLAALFIASIGFAIGAKSLLGILLSGLGVVFVFGFAFSYKKKLREKGLLDD